MLRSVNKRREEKRFKRGELQSRSRGSIFVLLWRCAWQFGEVLGGIFRLREGEESFRTEAMRIPGKSSAKRLLHSAMCSWVARRSRQFVQVGGHGRVALGIQLMIGRLIIWGTLLAGTKAGTGRYKGKLLACGLDGRPDESPRDLGARRLFQLHQVNSSKAYDWSRRRALRCQFQDVTFF